MLIKTIKEDRIQAMKDKDVVKRSILSTLLGELESDAKRKGYDITDLMIVEKCKKFISSAEDTAAELQGDTDRYNVLYKEIEILSLYLPKQLTEAELTHIINELATKNIGEIMSYLKENFAGRYDGGMASKIARNL